MVLHVLAHVAGLGQGGGIGDRKRHADDLGQGAGQQGLAGAGGAQQQDIGFVDLHLVLFDAGGEIVHIVHQALVVVIDRHRQGLLGHILVDDKFIQLGLDFHRWNGFDHRLGHRTLAPPTAHHLIGEVDTGLAYMPLLSND